MTPLKSNLVAIGTAAVVAVYSAGYVRTREAAERFAIEDSQRRAEHERRAERAARDTGHGIRDTGATKSESAPEQKASHDDAAARRAAAKPVERVHRAAAARVDSAPGAAPVAAPVAAPEAPAKPAESLPTINVPSPVAAPPPPTMTFTVTPPSQASTDTIAAEDKPMKDGVYSGWGRSRHGDIEATVAIKNGKIAEAFISQCLTQYSCSWVAALPPQVVARQSAEVDYVSGATQSTNAFYYAVIAALKKAK